MGQTTLMACRAFNLTRLEIWRILLPRPAITKRLTEASHQGRIHGFSVCVCVGGGGGGGGGELNSTRNFSCPKVESTRNSKFHQLSRRLQTYFWRPEDTAQNLEITDINLETGRYSSKSGDSQIIRES